MLSMYSYLLLRVIIFSHYILVHYSCVSSSINYYYHKLIVYK
nr:MAG TPA: hypothetical protein [Caudoviricetes sp.]